MFDSKKYILVFFITLGIFAVAFLLSEYFYNARVGQIRSLENNINQNILETEIQYALLADSACDDGGNTDGGSPILIDEINTLAKKLSYMEEERGTDDPEVIALKKYYSLLQVKDYLLLKEEARRCGTHEPTILYFYSNKGDCEECKKEGYVLTSLRETYPGLHIYAFDYNIGLTVIETLKSIYRLENALPAIVINRKPYYGYKPREEIENLIPNLALAARATTTKATTTKARAR